MKFLSAASLLLGLALSPPPVWTHHLTLSETIATTLAHVAQSQNPSPKNSGATASPAPDQSVFTLRTTANEVHLVFIVTDKQGHYIKDLNKDDFKILDDKKPPAEILSFASETNLPLQVGLLIDASESVTKRFKFEQQAAIEFLKETLRPNYDQAFVIGFDLTPKVTQDFTDNIERLSIGIHALRPGSLTALYDALYYACREKLLKHPQAGPVRRAIILLSDGNDNASTVTLEEAIEMAQRAEVTVYTISTNPKSHGRGNKNLGRIAEATGGRSFEPSQVTGVANAFTAIQEELRSQYAVSYKAADFKPDGHYRTIVVQAQNHKGLRVRSRKGYRSPDQYAPNQ